MMGDIRYPQGCIPILVEGLDTDELIRRLKMLAATLEDIDENDSPCEQYIPLALYLSQEHFLHHESEDVQLLIACCIVDFFRIFSPEIPYEDNNQIKEILLFLIQQLRGLKYPTDRVYKRCSYLLQKVVNLQIFRIILNIDGCKEVLHLLYSLMFAIIDGSHSNEVKFWMLSLLSSLLESDVIDKVLLEIILKNILEPKKTQRKDAYQLAKKLIKKCEFSLEPHIRDFISKALMHSDDVQPFDISKRVYDLIFELYQICPGILLFVMLQLPSKLQSNKEDERLEAVTLVARLFSDQFSDLMTHHKTLWRAFLDCFSDTTVSVRIRCLQHASSLLLSHHDFQKDIIDQLTLCQSDKDDNVRCEVVKTIVATAGKNFNLVLYCEDLLEILKAICFDTKFSVRKEALVGLATIYKILQNDSDVAPSAKATYTSIKDIIICTYYRNHVEDKQLVENLFSEYLVPFELPTKERMKHLYHFYGTLSDKSIKAFVKMQTTQMEIRKAVKEWLSPSTKSLDENIQNDLIQKISQFLPDPAKAENFLKEFSTRMLLDPELQKDMVTIVQPTVSCETSEEKVNAVLKKLGSPIRTNLLYETIKTLLYRVRSVIIDKAAIEELIHYVSACLSRGDFAEEMSLNPDNAGEKGLRLLETLSTVFGAHFLNNNLMHLIKLLRFLSDMVVSLVLSIFVNLTKYKPLHEVALKVTLSLESICRNYTENGTPKQAKHAIRCLDALQYSKFPEIIDNIQLSLVPNSTNYRLAIVTLGHVAYNLGEKYGSRIKHIIDEKIIRQLLGRPCSESEDVDNVNWCPREQLPEETQCKLEGLKVMARWSLGVQTDFDLAQQIFQLLNAFIKHKGNVWQKQNSSQAEMSWLRLQAGCAMLKICKQRGVGDQYTPEQFYNLSQLMVDEVPEVREAFVKKLHKSLGKDFPYKSLSLDFMGYYALACKEQDERLKEIFKNAMHDNIEKWKTYANNISVDKLKRIDLLPYILPDYTVVYAILVLAHDPEFTSHENVEQLRVIEMCLQPILHKVMTKNKHYSYAFYQTMVQKMKNSKDALSSENESMNFKLWAVCDIAMNIIYSKTKVFDFTDCSSKTPLPPQYFKQSEDLQENYKNYLPKEMQICMGEKDERFSVVATERPRQAKAKKRGLGIEAGETDAGLAEASEPEIPTSDRQDDSEEPPFESVLKKSKKTKKSYMN